MSVIAKTTLLLVLSNVFMTFAWYAHLRNLSHRAWYVAAVASWSIALFEYLLQVPANRIGYTALSLPQLKILQEVITLSIFIPFAILYMRQPVKLNYLGPVFVCWGRFTSFSAPPDGVKKTSSISFFAGREKFTIDAWGINSLEHGKFTIYETRFMDES